MQNTLDLKPKDLMKHLQASRRLCARCQVRAFESVTAEILFLPYNCRDGLLPLTLSGTDCPYFKEGF
jgi:hypothetical protein